MRVALLCATSARTGVETHLLMLARVFARAGVTPVLVCAGPGPLVERFDELGFAVRMAAPRGRLGGLALAGLARALGDVDVVHAHGPRAIYWSAVLRALGSRHPAVATVHQFQASGLERALHARAFAALERWSIRRHDRAITISRHLRQRLLAAGAVGEDRLDLIPNTVPLMLDRALVPRLAEPPPHALVAARFDPVKGLDVLVDAWALLRGRGVEVPLTILGEGPDRAALEARARARGVGDLVRCPGSVADVAARLETATLYVAPSRMEGLPGAVLEAMALGVPVVATDVPGHQDVLDSVTPEWLVPAEDPAAFAGAVERMLALAPTERLALGRRLQDRAYAAFDPVVIGEAVLATYRRAGARAAIDQVTGSAPS